MQVRDTLSERFGPWRCYFWPWSSTEVAQRCAGERFHKVAFQHHESLEVRLTEGSRFSEGSVHAELLHGSSGVLPRSNKMCSVHCRRRRWTTVKYFGAE